MGKEEEEDEKQGTVDKQKNWSAVNVACKESKLSFRGALTPVAFTNWLWYRCIRPKLEETKSKLPEIDIENSNYGIEEVEDLMKEFMPVMKAPKDKKDEKESDIPKAGVKDQTSKSGVKAFAGYGANRDTSVAKPPLSTLPYNGMDLPADIKEEKVKAADALIQNARDLKDEKAAKDKEAKALAAKLKKQYKERATEDLMIGKRYPIEAMLPKDAAAKAAIEGAAVPETGSRLQWLHRLQRPLHPQP